MRIICAFTVYNRLKGTHLALTALLDNKDPATEVFVVDNASDDKTREYLEQLKNIRKDFTLVRNEENVGVAGGQNQVMEQCRPEDYFCKIDNDILVTRPGWERWGIDCLEHNRDLGCMMFQLDGKPCHAENCEPKLRPYQIFYHNLIEVRLGDVLVAPTIMLPPHARAQVGFYYEYGPYGFDDVDMGERLKALGYKLAYADAGFKQINISEDNTLDYTEWKVKCAADELPEISQRLKMYQDGKGLYVPNIKERSIK